jgi:hypothetical protein
MEAAAGRGDVPAVLAMLKMIVPEYTAATGELLRTSAEPLEPARDAVATAVPAKRVQFA